MTESRKQKLAREMTHTKSSAGQFAEDEELVDLPKAYGGGKYLRKKQELEAPMFDPLDPFMLPKKLPAMALKGALAAAKGAGRAGAESVARGMEGYGPLAQVITAAKPSYVVKPKGGNWLSGSVENALKGLKKPVYGATSELPEDIAARLPRESINKWIEGPLTKYVKTRMASPDDEVRKLAEQGVLHYEPQAINSRTKNLEAWESLGQRQRMASGEPGSLAGKWEEVSDSQIAPFYIERPDHAEAFARLSGMPEGKTPPLGSTGFGMSTTRPAEDLGFPHLIDELSNALNPASGLPRNLLLTPEAMQQMGMEKAVRRVADINAWRAAQKAEANRALAEQASVLREYPEGQYFRAGEGMFFNPDRAAVEQFGQNFGGKVGQYHLEPRRPATDEDVFNVAKRLGVYQEGTPAGQYLEQGENAVFDEAPKLIEELRDMGFDSAKINDGISKQPSLVALDPSIIKESRPNPKGLRWVELKAKDESAYPDIAQMMGDTKERALSAKQRLDLQDQLKYEGEQMANCVGGYCDDVLSGRTRIMSLRDAKGQPHVTVEVAPDPEALTDAYRWDKPSITQIKYKGNSTTPVEDYLPFVQDFVRNSPLGKPWSDVKDLESAALTRRTDEGAMLKKFGRFDLDEDAYDLHKYDELPEYITDSEMADWLKKASGMAQGGRVYKPPVLRPDEASPTTGTRGHSEWSISEL